jgi:arginine-tRNA-protein transferase
MSGGASAALGHDERTRLLANTIERHAPLPGEPFPCPYLPGRMARHVTLIPSPLAPGLYHSLMDLNFRRTGPLFYRPQCDECSECRMIRVLVNEFRPSRSQRRCCARNADVTVTIGRPEPTEEKYQLYTRYLESRHDGQMDGSTNEFAALYTSLVRTREIMYRVEGRLLGAAVIDLEPEAMSAVYCYFAPEAEHRSPGVFNILTLIDECRRIGLPYLYLGFYVRGCSKMSYKADYWPHEIRQDDGRWVRSG